MIKLDEIEKAINQFLIAHGVIEDGKLVELLETIIKDFRNEKLRPLKESFVRINSKLRPLSMEVKSVVKSKCSACDAVTNVRASVCEACASATAKHEWVYYHGIVNTEEDHVSKAEGSELTLEEVKFFSELTLKLLESNYMSTDDVYRMKNEKWSHSTTDTALEMLRSKGWLQRDERSFWEIGVRTYLELRAFIEDSIRSLEPGDVEDVTHQRNVAEQIARLPQADQFKILCRQKSRERKEERQKLQIMNDNS